jgi:acyl-coenzyme A thioesterase PaaI-like protein
MIKLKQANARDCFVCGVENPVGLHLKFYQTSPNEVTANLTVPEYYQGYPGILHGGIAAALLDEAAGRALMGLSHQDSCLLPNWKLNIASKCQLENP